MYHDKQHNYLVLSNLVRKLDTIQSLNPKGQFELLCDIQAKINEILYSLLTEIHEQGGLEYENFREAKDHFETRAQMLKHHPSYTNSLYDQLVKVGTHSAFINTFLRQSVTGK